MKKKKLSLVILLFLVMFSFASCGTIVLSTRTDSPPPPWFYPNRVEAVRYVYFPDYLIYYDLSLQNYIYLNNGLWVSVSVLPPRYSHINLRRSRFVHIKGYRGDNISRYHKENYRDRDKSNRPNSIRNRRQ